MNNDGDIELDDNLRVAWRLLMLRQDDRKNYEIEEYIEEHYDIDFNSLAYLFSKLIEGEKITEDLLGQIFLTGFELGKLHERFVKDMEFLS